MVSSNAAGSGTNQDHKLLWKKIAANRYKDIAENEGYSGRAECENELLFADILFQIVTFSTFTVIKVDFLLPDFPGLKSVLFQFVHACKSNS